MEIVKRIVRDGLRYLGEKSPSVARLCLLIVSPSSKLFLFVARSANLYQVVMQRIWHIANGPLRGLKLTGLLLEEISPVLANGMEIRCSSLLTRLPLESRTVLDVGGSYGYYALLLSRLVGGSGHVYSFEPDWISFQRLTRNLSINDCNNVTAVPVCISNASGLAKWASFDDEPWNSKVVDNLVIPETHGFRLTVVPIMTLDEFTSALEISADIRLVKVDAEGAELSVLEGMNVLLGKAKPAILCELHSADVATKVFSFLSEQGYEWEMIENISETRQHILAFPKDQANQYRSVISSLT